MEKIARVCGVFIGVCLVVAAMVASVGLVLYGLQLVAGAIW